MANTFKNNFSKNVGTSAATVYTTPSATQTTIIGMSLANTTTNNITADVYITSGGVDYYIIKNGLVPVGGALIPIGGDQKVVLEPTDALKVVSSADTSLDVVCSILEIA
jgi:hypothetical protein